MFTKSKLFYFVLIPLLFALFTGEGCVQSQKPPRVQEFLGGERQLRKLVTNSGSDIKIHFSFFGTSANIKGQLCITFSWFWVDDSSYSFVSVPLSKTKVKLVDTLEIPTVEIKFSNDNWDNGYTNRFGDVRNMNQARESINNLVENYATWVVIRCKGSDWPENIELPLNKN